jgi:hypothetical protein
MSVKPYHDPGGIVLTDFSKPTDFIKKASAEGVSGQISVSEEKTTTGEPCGVFSAQNNGEGESSQDGSYINMEKTFSPWLDLHKNQALGLWIKGNGNGEILNLSIRSPINISHGAHGDHFVKIDFTGWKYFELVEIESSQISNYKWPDDSHFYVYDSYRHSVKFESVERLQLWFNNLHPRKRACTVLGPVKALPMVAGFIENPSVTINGERILFPVRMESGMFLEFLSADDCKLFGSRGELIKKLKPEGAVPNLKKGHNKILFSGEGPDDVEARVQVTVISQGAPLDMK